MEPCNICTQFLTASFVNKVPLSMAVELHNTEMVALLLSHGADVDIADDEGNTPLILAVRESRISWPIVQILLLSAAR